VVEADIAVSIDAARELLKNRSYDLLLLDVYFPAGRGPDLLQWIRSEELSLNVIFITADNSQNTVERALHLGAMDYLVKPFSFARFKAALEDAHSRIKGIYNEKEFDQQTLDQVFHKKGGSSGDIPEDLDKGMSYKTFEMVRNEVFKTSGYFTAEQMGEKLGMARVTIRRYLDFMEKQSLLEVELQYGKIGRPQHNYRVKGRK
jgi:response regulator of citrate/malate metabolism